MAGVDQLTISLNQLFGWSTAISCFVAIGVCALWSIGFNRIKEGQKAEFQQQIENQKAEFSKQLENLKAKNEKINYITKTQFDAEFKIYQELSKIGFEAIVSLSYITKEFHLENYEEDYNSKSYITSTEKINDFAEQIFKYAPFIKEKLYDKYIGLSTKITELNKNVKIQKDGTIANKENLVKEANQIIKIHSCLVKELRIYLQSLRIIEDYNEQNS